MAALAKVIRNTSRQYCKDLFQSIPVQYPIRWEDPELSCARIIQEVKTINSDDLEKMRAVSERVQRLSEDDLGQDILLAQVSDKISLKALDNPYDRAAWVFRNDPEAFKRAEHYYFHDAHRNSRMWEGYRLQNPCDLDKTKLHGSFHDQLKAYFGNTDELLLEVYDRELVDGDQSHTLYQVMIYREGLPSLVNELGQKVLNARIIKPVRESALTWDPKTGEMEVVSRNREDRKKVAQLFALEVVGDNDPDAIPLKQYDLETLRSRPVFDFDITDGIASVAVTQLILKSRRTHAFFSVKSPSGKGHELDVYEALIQDGLPHFLSKEGFDIHSARLSVQYRPTPNAEKSKTLSFDITMPNRCNLKDKKHIEQTLNNHLLEHWGLLKEVE